MLRLSLQFGLRAGLLLFSSSCFGQQPSTSIQPTRETYLKLAGEVDNALLKDVLDVWFPRAVDKEKGGFPFLPRLAMGAKRREIFGFPGPHDLGCFPGGAARARQEE
jgi:hypothetical protein